MEDYKPLVKGHFDSTLGSPGAADCASCVGIMLEALRVMVAAMPPPAAPVVFLFNGGEETFVGPGGWGPGP